MGGMAENVRSMAVKIEKVDVVDPIQDQGDIVSKGMDFLKSRLSILGTGQHAEYTMLVNWDGKTHRVRKRFSEFSSLHDLLKDHFPMGLTFDLPAKTPVRFFSEEALQERQMSLNAYLKELCRHTDIINLAQVQIFFGILGGGTGMLGSGDRGGGGGSFVHGQARPVVQGQARPPVQGSMDGSRGGGYGGNYGGGGTSSYSGDRDRGGVTYSGSNAYDRGGSSFNDSRTSGGGSDYPSLDAPAWTPPAWTTGGVPHQAPAVIQGAPATRQQRAGSNSDDDLHGWDS